MAGKSRIGMGLAVLGAAVICICCIRTAGKSGGGDGVQGGTGTAYVPEFLPCSFPCGNVSRICGNGKELFVAGDMEEEIQTAQGEDIVTVYAYRMGIFRVSLDGMRVEELEEYRPSWEGDSDEGNVFLENLAFDREGRLWVTEQVNRNRYELPEGFDEAVDMKWDYLVGTESSYVFRQLDSRGREQKRIETGDLAQRIGLDSISSVALGQDGSIYVLGSGTELVLLTEKELGSLEEKIVLTYATLQLGYEDRMRIIRFNKQSEKYRVEIQDYSELDTESDSQAGLSRLNADILAGNVPDILGTGNLPMRQYIQKGLLENLWPFTERWGAVLRCMVEWP